MKTTVFKIFVYFIFFGLLVACDANQEDCNRPGELSGIAEKSLGITCFPSPTNGEYAIQSQAQLDAVFQHSISGGIPCNLDTIDFNTHSLLGFYTAANGCEARFDKEVERVETLRRYIFRVSVVVCNPCQSNTFSYNWVLVPKLPPGWTVDFIRD